MLLKAPPKAGGSEERGGDGDYEAKIVSCFADLCLAEEWRFIGWVVTALNYEGWQGSCCSVIWGKKCKLFHRLVFGWRVKVYWLSGYGIELWRLAGFLLLSHMRQKLYVVSQTCVWLKSEVLLAEWLWHWTMKIGRGFVAQSYCFWNVLVLCFFLKIYKNCAFGAVNMPYLCGFCVCVCDMNMIYCLTLHSAL